MINRMHYRNYYYKGILARKRGKSLGDCPTSYNYTEKCAWAQGFNEEDVAKSKGTTLLPKASDTNQESYSSIF